MSDNEESIEKIREAWAQDARSLDRICAEWRRRDEQLIAALSTPEHHKVMRAGLPFCKCGWSLDGGDATGAWITHRLIAVRAMLDAAEETP